MIPEVTINANIYGYKSNVCCNIRTLSIMGNGI